MRQLQQSVWEWETAISRLDKIGIESFGLKVNSPNGSGRRGENKRMKSSGASIEYLFWTRRQLREWEMLQSSPPRFIYTEPGHRAALSGVVGGGCWFCLAKAFVLIGLQWYFGLGPFQGNSDFKLERFPFFLTNYSTRRRFFCHEISSWCLDSILRQKLTRIGE